MGVIFLINRAIYTILPFQSHAPCPPLGGKPTHTQAPTHTYASTGMAFEHWNAGETEEQVQKLPLSRHNNLKIYSLYW